MSCVCDKGLNEMKLIRETDFCPENCYFGELLLMKGGAERLNMRRSKFESRKINPSRKLFILRLETRWQSYKIGLKLLAIHQSRLCYYIVMIEIEVMHG